MKTKICNWLIMDRVQIGLFDYVPTDNLMKALQKCSYSSPLCDISFLSKPIHFISCHGKIKATFEDKNLQKSSPQKSLRYKAESWPKYLRCYQLQTMLFFIA